MLNRFLTHLPLLSKTDSSKLENGKALVGSHPLILPPRHERLGVREHTRPACTFDQLSSARALVVHRRNEVGFLPARAGQASTSESLHARRVCSSFTASRYQLAVRRPHPSSADRTSSPKAIPERCQGASIADHLFNQRLFWTALHISPDLNGNHRSTKH
jgi:hypothetical protein